MRTDQNSIESGLAAAIRATGTPDFPAALFDYLVAATEADNLVILAFPKGNAPQVLFHKASDPRVFAQIETTYVDGAYLLDPLYELQLSEAPPGAYRLLEIAPDAFHRSRYFQEYYQQTTILDEVGFLLYPRPGVGLTLCLARDASSGRAFSARAIETCHRIAPIVTALAERHWPDIAAPAQAGPDALARMKKALERDRGILLSGRQSEVALLILRGHSTASIAQRLGLSPLTVKVFRRQIYERCGISSQAELFALMIPHLDTGRTGPDRG
ncbi:response regulator transcription factor [Rhodobacter sp. SY28-1]|uniref:response regulator transcription factor n=1 Tax=Rhodobacter sp. SY28-1 TaxID=2562317 RepID=UPI0010BFF635|nr:helix-turn-helix transcriptional regulator [Rhodobacter sp. SY28-1]